MTRRESNVAPAAPESAAGGAAATVSAGEVARRKARYWATEKSAAEYEQALARCAEAHPVCCFETMLLRHFIRGCGADFGAGTGRICAAVAPRAERVTAIDVSAAMLERIGSRGLTNVELRQSSAFATGLPDGRLDWATAFWLLVHFANWPEIVREMARVTKSGGMLCFDIPNGDAWALGCSVAQERLEARQADPATFEAYCTRGQIEETLRSLGLIRFHIRPYGLFNDNVLVRAYGGDEPAAGQRRWEDERFREPWPGTTWALFEAAFFRRLPKSLARRYFVVATTGEGALPRWPTTWLRESFFRSAAMHPGEFATLLLRFDEIARLAGMHDSAEILARLDGRFAPLVRPMLMKREEGSCASVR